MRSTLILTKGAVAVLMICSLMTLTIQDGGSLPPNWWLQSNAEPVNSYSEYQNLLETDYKNKFVFIDFYMQHCPWCYYILEDLNKLIDDMNIWYGPEKFVVVKCDGQKIKQMSNKYNVPSYPHFVAVAPNSGGKLYSTFKLAPRNYDTLKKWMLEVMGNTPLHSEALTPGSVQQYQSDIPSEVDDLKEQIQELMTSQSIKNKDILIQQASFTDAVKKVYEQGYVGNQKLDKVLTILDLVMNEPDAQPEQPKVNDSLLTSPMYYILGLVSGSIMSVIGVSWINKQNKLNKLNKRRYKKGPSSDSPVRLRDEEKSA